MGYGRPPVGRFLAEAQSRGVTDKSRWLTGLAAG